MTDNSATFVLAKGGSVGVVVVVVTAAVRSWVLVVVVVFMYCFASVLIWRRWLKWRCRRQRRMRDSCHALTPGAAVVVIYCGVVGW